MDIFIQKIDDIPSDVEENEIEQDIKDNENEDESVTLFNYDFE
jgi:hypothetical protein